MSDRAREPLSREQRVHRTRLVVALILIAVLLVFAFQNRTKVNIDFIVTDSDTRLIFVIIGSALLGAIVGALVRHSWRRRDRT